MVLCEWAAWLVYCFVAMLLYLPVGGGGGGSCPTAAYYIATICCFTSQTGAARSVLLCYFTGLFGLYAAGLLLFCFAIGSLSGRYAASLIFDVASRGLLGPCGAFSLDSFTSRGLFSLCVAWLILPLFRISLSTKNPSCSVAPSFVARLSLLHMRADIDSHMLFYARFTCGHACCAKCNYALPFVS